MSLSTAVFDLETSDLEADRGVILCACIKSSKARGIITYRIDETDYSTWSRGKRGVDKNLVRAISDELESHDVLVAHNGQNFDLPMIRTRQVRWRQRRLPDMKVVDPWLIAKRKFRLKSNSLGRIADYLGITDRKTPLDMSTWAAAMNDGDRRALNDIVRHCQADVRVLDGVFDLVKPFVKVLDDRGSAL